MSDLLTTFRWSFSQWEAYNQCPAKWKFQSVLKLPRKPPGPAAFRGLQMHKTVEKFIEGEHGTEGLHEDIKPKYIPILVEFREHTNGDRYVEKKLAFDHEWYPCSPRSEYAACVAVLDAVRFTKKTGADSGLLHIGEWKSGKPKDTHRDQRSLYAMFGMRNWHADRVEVTTHYLEGTSESQRLILESESGFQKLKNQWQSRIDTMHNDQMCAPRPGFHCRWCDYNKADGGPCIF